MCRSEDFIPDLEFRFAIGRLGGEGGDDAGEFSARYPGKGGLVLVSARYLEEVEEVRAGGVHADGVLARIGDAVGQGGDLEVEGSLLD